MQNNSELRRVANYFILFLLLFTFALLLESVFGILLFKAYFQLCGFGSVVLFWLVVVFFSLR